jgi:hypothetical protein
MIGLDWSLGVAPTQVSFQNEEEVSIFSKSKKLLKS